MKRFSDYFVALIVLCGLYACADNTEVGSGLLGSEDIEVLFTDDFDIEMSQLGPEPLTYVRSQFHSLGTLDDATFGKLASSFYVRPQLSTTSPNFMGGTFDSVALVLKIDTSRYFGNERAFFDIEVFELLESIDNIDTFRTDQTFMFDSSPLGSISRLVPGDLDSIRLLDERGDTTYFSNAVMIKLNRRFGASIFIDTLNNKTVDGFASLLNGFFVQATSNNSLIQLDLANEVSSMVFFYKDEDGTPLNFPYRFNTSYPIIYDYDIGGSELENAIENGTVDDLYYLQGHAGATIEIDISDIHKLDDPFVNYATIEITALQDGPIDTTRFALPLAVDLLTNDEDGSLISILDLGIGALNGQVGVIFDGEKTIDEDDNVVRYEMNITNQVKDILDGQQSSKLYLTVRNRVQNPNNVIIYGPNHPTYPARLKLTYTKS